MLFYRNSVYSYKDTIRRQCVMAHTTSWQELNDTFTAITEVFQSNEDPLHC